ncbi:MAG: DUF5702 domain-containing protein [Eubacterium sp.]|nr:DUF5702 domain-containing protein [Eubacterium sp.]
MRAFRLFRKLNTCSDVSGAGNNERSENGSITIFLSCILLPLIIAEMTIINLCALTAAKQIVNDAGKMSSNAALTDYNKTLHDMYGLIVFNGDGSEAISRAESTFKENICTGASTGYKEVEAGKNRDWFERKKATWSMGRKNRSVDVSVEMDSSSVLANTDVFKGQICDAMRYNYKATEQITPEDLEYYARYPDSIDAIKSKIEYDEELYDYFDDCLELVEELKMNIVDPQEDESGNKNIVYQHRIYEKTEIIKNLCKDVIKHKALLEQKKQGWNSANQKAGLSDDLRSVLVKSYNEETALELHFDEVQKISDVMDEFDLSTKAYEKYLTQKSIEYIDEENPNWDAPIDAIKAFMAFKDFTETSEDYRKLKDNYKKLVEDYDSLNNSWEREQLLSLEYNQAYNTNMIIDGSETIDGNYTPVFPQDLNFSKEYSKGHVDYKNLNECVSKEFVEMEKTASFYKNMNGAIYAVKNDSVQLLESEYATEFFAGFHRSDNYSLTGWNIWYSDLGSEYICTQQEYLLFGQASARANVSQVDMMVYYSEYINNLIKEYTTNYFGSGPGYYNGMLCPGDASLKNYFRKDLVCMKNAKSKADTEFAKIVYDWEADEDGWPYSRFMKLFMLIQVTNNEDTVLSRMRNVIEMNVGSTYGGEDFSFDTAYTAATINAQVHIDGVIGGGSTYEYNTFAMY